MGIKEIKEFKEYLKNNLKVKVRYEYDEHRGKYLVGDVYLEDEKITTIQRCN